MPFATNLHDGVKTHYEIDGEGTPVVLFPGTFGTIAIHYDYGWVDALRDDFQLVLVDSRGQGKSEKPHELGAYSWDILASDVIAALDHAGIEKAHIAGYSTGGLIAFRVGARYPDRVYSIVAGGAQPFATTPESQAGIARIIENLRQGSQHIVDGFERMSGGNLPPRWRADLSVCDTEALTALCQAEADERGLSEVEVRSIEVPALIYSGDDDEEDAGSNARRAAEMMPNATFIELPDTNHVQGLLNSHLILPSIVEFLRHVEGGRR